MPYKLDGSDAPDNIRKLPARRRRQWIRIWNSAFERCQRRNNKNCEATAFAQANGTVLKK